MSRRGDSRRGRVHAAVSALVAVLVGIGTPSVARWEGQQVLSLTGSGFDPTVTIYADGLPLTTTYVSSSACTAVLPRTYLWENGTVAITAKNASTAASSARTFTVTQPAYLDAEFRADRGVTLNGSTVSAWANQSGVGDATRNAVQPTAGLQPTYTASNAAYNSKPTLAMGGTRWMRTGTYANPVFGAAPYRHYVVGAITNNPGVFIDSMPTGPRLFWYKNAATTFIIAAALGQQTTAATTPSTKGVFVAEHNTSNIKFSKSAKTLANLGTVTTVTPPLGLTIGAALNDTIPMAGDIAHILSMTAANTITAAQHGEIMDYLGSLYGETIAA